MKTVIANWKMNLGIRESVALARGVLRRMRGKELLPDVVLCPSFTALSEVHKVTARSRVMLGAQNCGTVRSGAFTGEVSAAMLEDVRCSYVILGHSERRKYFGETDELVGERLKHVVEQSKLIPIVCVGESKEDHDAGKSEEVIESQLRGALSSLRGLPRGRKLFIAYEPVWAISTQEGITPVVGDMVEMHAKIRQLALARLACSEDQLQVIYGGSVNGENAYQYLRESEIDGVLVGGASLRLAQFDDILTSTVEVLEAQNAA